MATFAVTDAKILVAQYDLTGDSNRGLVSGDIEELDSTNFGSGGWRERKAGVGDAAATLEGFNYADGTSGPDDAFWARHGSGDVITVGPTGGDEGENAYTFQSLTGSYEQTANHGELYGWSVSASGRGNLVKGTVLEDASTARTATFNGTGRQLGSVASGEKLYAALHVLSASGTSPTLDVVVQSDDNSGFTSPTSRITFTQATGTTHEWGTPVDGAVADDWYRISVTIGGTSPSFEFFVVVGIA